MLGFPIVLVPALAQYSLGRPQFDPFGWGRFFDNKVEGDRSDCCHRSRSTEASGR